MEKYKSWISKVPGQLFKAKWKLYMKEFDVENIGKFSLDSHISDKKHKDRVKQESICLCYNLALVVLKHCQIIVVAIVCCHQP